MGYKEGQDRIVQYIRDVRASIIADPDGQTAEHTLALSWLDGMLTTIASQRRERGSDTYPTS